jgi:hypothetical protein
MGFKESTGVGCEYRMGFTKASSYLISIAVTIPGY